MARRRLALPLLGALAAATIAACGAGATTTATQAPPTATAQPSPTPSAPVGRPLIPVAGQPPVTGHPWYLAVGDSVTSGFSTDPARHGTNSAWALQLQTMLAASGRPWSLYDTACPGERTDTYYARCPGRTQIPLLATTSQHDAAMAAITAHRADLRAILVDLGSNDLLRSVRTATAVDTEIGALRTALTRIVTDLHAAAPGVPVVIGNYYNPLANADPATRPQLAAVNAMVASVASATGSRLADFFAAINTTPNATDPHLCDYIDCAHTDIHPTVAGHTALARAALAALG